MTHLTPQGKECKEFDLYEDTAVYDEGPPDPFRFCPYCGVKL